MSDELKAVDAAMAAEQEAEIARLSQEVADLRAMLGRPISVNMAPQAPGVVNYHDQQMLMAIQSIGGAIQNLNSNIGLLNSNVNLIVTQLSAIRENTKPQEKP